MSAPSECRQNNGLNKNKVYIVGEDDGIGNVFSQAREGSKYPVSLVSPQRGEQSLPDDLDRG